MADRKPLVLNGGEEQQLQSGDRLDAALKANGVGAGSYTAPNVTVDDQGRVTSIANGTAFVSPLPVVNGGTGASDAATARTNLGLGSAAVKTADTDTTLATGTNLPTAGAVKSYVDNALTGLSWKQAVRAATTANGTLSTAFANGQTVDGVTLATGDRILIKNQTAASANGVYVVAASGSPTRAADADAGAELVNATVFVSEGTANADTVWTCTTNAAITVGTTGLAFAQVAGAGTYTAGAGLTLTGNQFSVADNALLLAKLQQVDPLSVLANTSNALGNVSFASAGAADQVFHVNPGGTAIGWGAINLSSANAVTGFLGTALGGTGLQAYTLGDTIYCSASNVLSKLAGNTAAVIKFLGQTGTGSASAAPAWQAGATQSDQETATSVVAPVTPGVQQFHPSAAKAWVTITVSGTTVTMAASYNVSSVTRNAAGDYTVNFTTAFSSASYAMVGTCGLSTSGGTILGVLYSALTAPATGSCRVVCVNFATGTGADTSRGTFVFYGDQ